MSLCSPQRPRQPLSEPLLPEQQANRSSRDAFSVPSSENSRCGARRPSAQQVHQMSGAMKRLSPLLTARNPAKTWTKDFVVNDWGEAGVRDLNQEAWRASHHISAQTCPLHLVRSCIARPRCRRFAPDFRVCIGRRSLWLRPIL